MLKRGLTEEMVLAALTNNSVEKDPVLVDMFEKAAAAEGQSVEEAKKETLKLLQKVLGK